MGWFSPEYLQDLISTYGYWAVGGIVGLESLGLPLPGETALVLAGLYAGMSSREFERAVFAALILAGEPVNNHRLAELMDCSPDEASRRVAQLEGVIRKARNGREVLLRTLTTMLKLPMGTAAARVALPVL